MARRTEQEATSRSTPVTPSKTSKSTSEACQKTRLYFRGVQRPRCLMPPSRTTFAPSGEHADLMDLSCGRTRACASSERSQWRHTTYRQAMPCVSRMGVQSRATCAVEDGCLKPHQSAEEGCLMPPEARVTGRSRKKCRQLLRRALQLGSQARTISQGMRAPVASCSCTTTPESSGMEPAFTPCRTSWQKGSGQALEPGPTR